MAYFAVDFEDIINHVLGHRSHVGVVLWIDWGCLCNLWVEFGKF